MNAPDWPRGVTDPLCPAEHVITTSTDRRLLWHLEMVLSGIGGDRARDTVLQLNRYLAATCEHHWHDYEAGYADVPAHRQCLWCHDVEWTEVPG